MQAITSASKKASPAQLFRVETTPGVERIYQHIDAQKFEQGYTSEHVQKKEAMLWDFYTDRKMVGIW